MEQLFKIIKEVQSVKSDLENIDRVCEDLIQPFILIKDETQARNEMEASNTNDKVKDLKVLLKLRNVLTKAYVTDKPQIKDVSSKTKTVREERILMSKVNMTKQPTSIKPSQKITTVRKPHFVPAHLNAPFKTDHNLHRPKTRINCSQGASSRRSKSSTCTDYRNTLTKVTASKCHDSVVNGLIESEGKVSDQRVAEEIKVKDINSIFSELKEEILKLEEESPVFTEVSERKPKLLTVFEAGRNLKVPGEIKQECKTRLRLLSTLDNIFLQNIKSETQSSGYKSRRKFVEDMRGESHAEERNRRLIVLEKLLEEMTIFCKSMDLVSNTSSQVAFIRACLSWALSEFVDVGKINDPFLETITTSPSFISPDLLNSEEEDGGISFWEGLVKTARISNYGFISASASNNGGRPCLSLAVSRPRKSPFVFSLRSSIIPIFDPSVYERQSLQLAVSLQTKLYWSTLLTTWTRDLQERSQKKDNACCFYRQLYGLLLQRYPVVLRDML